MSSTSANVSPIKKPSSSSNQQNQQNCSVCSERGFVTKTATPRFPHKDPPPPPPPPKVCHGCVERAAILYEVASLREMVLALSNGILELNQRVAIQKQQIVDLESELKNQKRVNVSLQTQQAAPQPTITSASNPAASIQSTQVSSLLEKMLNNNLPAMEARVLTHVRKAETQHNTTEFKSIREDLQRKSTELTRDFERNIRNLESQYSESDRQVRDSINQQDRRMRRAFHQLCQSLGVAVPPAVSVGANVAFSSGESNYGGATTVGDNNSITSNSMELPRNGF